MGCGRAAGEPLNVLIMMPASDMSLAGIIILKAPFPRREGGLGVRFPYSSPSAFLNRAASSGFLHRPISRPLVVRTSVTRSAEGSW